MKLAKSGSALEKIENLLENRQHIGKKYMIEIWITKSHHKESRLPIQKLPKSLIQIFQLFCVSNLNGTWRTGSLAWISLVSVRCKSWALVLKAYLKSLVVGWCPTQHISRKKWNVLNLLTSSREHVSKICTELKFVDVVFRLLYSICYVFATEEKHKQLQLHNCATSCLVTEILRDQVPHLNSSQTKFQEKACHGSGSDLVGR